MIDFLYVEEGGRVRRYRRDAKIQTAAGAKAEATRLQTIAVITGTLQTRVAAPTLRAFALGQFATLLKAVPKLPRLHKESRKLPDCPSRREVSAMLSGSIGWLRVPVALGALAGLRLGEVRALEVGDVDFAENVIRIRRALSEDEVVTPKSGHERLVPMTDELRVVLEGAVCGKLPRTRVITTENGTTPRRTLVLRKFKALQRRLGLPGWSFHSLRHAFISELVRAGASIEAVRLLAGHSKLDVTQRYVHAMGEDVRAAVAKL